MDMDMDFMFEMPCYGVSNQEKNKIFSDSLSRLTKYHIDRCSAYQAIINSMPFKEYHFVEDLPFLSVRLFKQYELKSIERSNIVKTLTSSGTTSQQVSKIYLDQKTSYYQTKALATIVKEFLGPVRLPMLIVDTQAVLKDRYMFSARGAGILGFSNFGRNHTYLLSEDMKINFEVLENFILQNEGKPVFIFGFTFMIWEYFVKLLKENNKKIDLSSAILIHGGGWKKLQDRAVDNQTFKKQLYDHAEISHVHNFYGMVEQVGSIFVECAEGYLHTPFFSDVIVRDPLNWSILPYGQKGVIQVLSLLPHSYPGHNLMTEDLGVIFGHDDCICGRKGKYFTVLGRIAKAELRGCSDAHSA